jgi:hypothetical protein
VHSWNTFGAGTSHGQTWTHKTHHGLDLGEDITFPLIVYFVLGHGTSTQMSFCPETSTLSRNSQNWDSIDLISLEKFLDCACLKWAHMILDKGEGGGFPQVYAVVNLVSPCCPWLVLAPKVL